MTRVGFVSMTPCTVRPYRMGEFAPSPVNSALIMTVSGHDNIGTSVSGKIEVQVSPLSVL